MYIFVIVTIPKRKFVSVIFVPYRITVYLEFDSTVRLRETKVLNEYSDLIFVYVLKLFSLNVLDNFRAKCMH